MLKWLSTIDDHNTHNRDCNPKIFHFWGCLTPKPINLKNVKILIFHISVAYNKHPEYYCKRWDDGPNIRHGLTLWYTNDDENLTNVVNRFPIPTSFSMHKGMLFSGPDLISGGLLDVGINWTFLRAILQLNFFTYSFI